jgi:hypothetical protein
MTIPIFMRSPLRRRLVFSQAESQRYKAIG